MPDEALGSPSCSVAQRSQCARSMERECQGTVVLLAWSLSCPSVKPRGARYMLVECTVHARGVARRREQHACTLYGTIQCDLTLLKQALKI